MNQAGLFIRPFLLSVILNFCNNPCLTNIYLLDSPILKMTLF